MRHHEPHGEQGIMGLCGALAGLVAMHGCNRNGTHWHPAYQSVAVDYIILSCISDVRMWCSCWCQMFAANSGMVCTSSSHLLAPCVLQYCIN
jgi:hypothetical protein